MKRTQFAIATLTILLVGTTPPAPAWGCGESLYRVGQGLRYKAPSAPLPANVLFYPTSDKQKEIISKLIEAGHSVTVVSEPSQITEAMASQAFDIVIAPMSEKHLADDGGASVIPLAANRQEQRLATNQYRRSLRTSDDLLDYLRTIHYAMEDRSRI